MLIKVTQEDIDAGLRWDCYKCPIARAVKRAFSSDGYVSAATNMIDINDYLCFKTPFIAKVFIGDFDRCREVKPIEFELTETI